MPGRNLWGFGRCDGVGRGSPARVECQSFGTFGRLCVRWRVLRSTFPDTRRPGIVLLRLSGTPSGRLGLDCFLAVGVEDEAAAFFALAANEGLVLEALPLLGGIMCVFGYYESRSIICALRVVLRFEGYD